MCLLGDVEKGWLFPQKSSLRVIQRSQGYPYLWISLRCDETGFVAACTGASVYAIAWNDCSWFKGARNRLQSEAGSRRIQQDLGEEEAEEE